MTRSIEIRHSEHRGVDESCWRILEASGGALIIQAWPDDLSDNSAEHMQSVTLRRFGTEIAIDPPEVPRPQGSDAPAFSVVNRLQLYRAKLRSAGVPDELVPPFVVHTSEVEEFLRCIHVPKWHQDGVPVDVQEQEIAKLLSTRLANVFGVRMAWSPETDRWVRPG